MKRLNEKYEVTDDADCEIDNLGWLQLRSGSAVVLDGGRAVVWAGGCAVVLDGGMLFKYEDTPVLADDGEYYLRRSPDGRYYAGCRVALTAAEALKHWDREDDRACLFTIAIGMIGNAK